MRRYNPKQIEPKWQAEWAKTKLYLAKDGTRPKRYILEYFPYPSGAAMHVGHVRNYAIGDVLSRYQRMMGANVLHPMGWDAFGLPAENYAIKHKVSPRQAIDANTSRFKKQLTQMGFGYDWSREIDSTDPAYYRWTQWLFLLLFKRGLAYQKESLQWWCPFDKTVLANEQVENGRCWRCGHEVELKSLKQWFFKITKYSDRLLKGLDDLDWPQAIKTMQTNWIGRSDGLLFRAPVKDTNLTVETFSAHFEAFRADSFVVIAPDHPFLPTLVKGTDHQKHVLDYAEQIVRDRTVKGHQDNQHIEGIFTGRYIEDPVSGQDLPIWVASFALADYGTGIVKCSAHDERDFRFAKKYNLKLKPVMFPSDEAEATKVRNLEYCFSDAETGILSEPSQFAGQPAAASRQAIAKYLEQEGLAKPSVSYKIRDWLISRQRYWGAPIPIIHCPKDGSVAVPDADLPVELPEVRDYQPAGDGHSPLAKVDSFVKTKCPKCGGPATRETDTMDGFACSSWYYLRFADPHNDKQAFSQAKAQFWLPVDEYIGGAEHAVMHLLYARFWTKVMFDAGLIDFEEPFLKLRNQGMILAPDGSKMSKSRGNTIEPDGLIAKGYGADSIRIMELFLGPWDQAVNWSVDGIAGAHRFLARVWTLVLRFNEAGRGDKTSVNLLRLIHRTIKKVSSDMETISFNTAIAALMEYVNELYKLSVEDDFKSREWPLAVESLLKLLAPFSPHLAEELWHELGAKASIHLEEWPKFDDKLTESEEVTIVIQVNGRLRGQVRVDRTTEQAEIVELAKTDSKVSHQLEGRDIKKTIYVAGRLINFVV